MLSLIIKPTKIILEDFALNVHFHRAILAELPHIHCIVHFYESILMLFSFSQKRLYIYSYPLVCL